MCVCMIRLRDKTRQNKRKQDETRQNERMHDTRQETT